MDSGSTIAFNLTRVPEQWREFTERSLRAWKAKSFSMRRMLGGKSGAVVMLVEIVLPEFGGQAILKLSHDSLGEERERQEQARSVSSSLARRIPRIEQFNDAEESHSALLMAVAGRGLLETEVMANARGGPLNLASQKVSTSLLTEWNASPSFAGEGIRADALLAEWLEYRIGADSRVPDVLWKLLHISPDSETFRYDGVDYPNPYGFSNPAFPGSSIELFPSRGRMHGDLHAENILIRGKQIDEYYFIDFSFFRQDAPLFFDHAYLELHLLFVLRETATHERWNRLLRSLVGLNDTQSVQKNVLDQDDHGLLWTVAMIRAEVFRWIDTNAPNRLEDLKKQILLSRIAAGLNFANKRSLAEDAALSEKKKVFSFLYAASAAKELFDYCKLRVKSDGPVARPEIEIPAPSGNAWRNVWDTCGGFDGRRGAYVLLAGPDVGRLPQVSRTQLGRLPWSLVIDFDPVGPLGALVASAGAALKHRRGVHLAFPHQAITVEFGTGTCWLFADAEPSADKLKSASHFPQWRQRTLPTLRKIASEMRKVTVPQPTYLVVLGESVDPQRLAYTVTTLEDGIGDTLEICVVSKSEDDPTYAAVCDVSGTVRNIICDWRDLALGVHEMLGDSSDQSGTWIPVRDPSTKSIRREQIDPVDVALYGETIEIVPAGLAIYQQDNTDVSDFLKGNTITWRELDLHLDVDRDITKGATGALQRVRTMLAASPTDSFAIEHTPGAGGTTVARRLAWDLRDEYPCIILKSFTENTPDFLEAIFQRSNLPLFIVAEALKWTRILGPVGKLESGRSV
jgi:hypothetical protein